MVLILLLLVQHVNILNLSFSFQIKELVSKFIFFLGGGGTYINDLSTGDWNPQTMISDFHTNETTNH